ncbi:LacI family transcriptional regulator [bacterium]|nr:LacI family transcriptional regulator [bacterium]
MKNAGSSPTIYDVAKEASVSIATVSRVLNSSSNVKAETRDRVLKAIDDLGFVPNAIARDRARKEGGHIGVITPFFTTPSVNLRLSGIAETLVDTAYDFTIFPVDSKRRLDAYYAELPYSNLVNGVIILTLKVDEKSLERFQTRNIPLLLIENQLNGYSSIGIDDEYGGQIAAEHFIQKEYTKCAYIGNSRVPEFTLNHDRSRFEGYRQTLEQHGMEMPEAYIKWPTLHSNQQDKEINALLDLDNPPRAVFTSTDEIALRVLKVAKNKGVRIPEDLALIGFDDIEIAEYLDLTTISQSLFESGKLAAEHLISRVANPNRPIQNTFIQLKLIERKTT